MASRPDPVLGPAFGAVLRRERERLDVSQQAIADYSGEMSRSRLSQIESGIGGSPTLRTIRRIAGALGMLPSELLALVEAYAAAPCAAQDGDAKDHRPSPGEMREPAVSSGAF